jgi:hypothetical protein
MPVGSKDRRDSGGPQGPLKPVPYPRQAERQGYPSLQAQGGCGTDLSVKNGHYAIKGDALKTGDVIDMVYDQLEGYEDLLRYHDEHGTPSLLVLTQHTPKVAMKMAELLDSEIAGKRVIEIGAGVGFLAIELAKRAKSVHAIEVDPAWSWTFTKSLYAHKPKNLTWIFGKAEEVSKWLKGDVVICCTCSGIPEMRKIASRFGPKVIFPLQDMKCERPELVNPFEFKD